MLEDSMVHVLILSQNVLNFAKPCLAFDLFVSFRLSMFINIEQFL